MAKLILSMDGLVLKEIQLDKERITIGRKPHNDIQIDNMAISGEHAAIVTILSDSFLEDLDSTNGTLVNGQSIKKHFLRNNDLVELGKYKLKYMADLPGTSAVGEADKIPAKPAAPQPVPEATSSSSAAGVLAAIQVLNGGNAGKELVLTKNLTTLGKPGVQVAVIARRPQGYFISHAEGAHLPIVNGKPLEGQARQLADHDVIEIAGIRMEFFFKT